MDFKIYRSVSFSEKTKWSYPLYYVEVITNEKTFDIYIYDSGFEPPYYDVSPSFGLDPFVKMEMVGGLKEADKFLKKRNIYANAWRKVEHLYAIESNYAIRPDIRTESKNFYYPEDYVFESISRSKVDDLFNEIKILNGNSAEILIRFLNKSNKFFTFSNSYYLLFREPSRYGNKGFVAKGNQDNISLLIEFNGDLKCCFYNQITKTFYDEVKIIRIELRFITEDISLTLYSNCFTKNHIKNFELINFNQ